VFESRPPVFESQPACSSPGLHVFESRLHVFESQASVFESPQPSVRQSPVLCAMMTGSILLLLLLLGLSVATAAKPVDVSSFGTAPASAPASFKILHG
jgi:hypothetical protein